jgi:hypothetical protein
MVKGNIILKIINSFRYNVFWIKHDPKLYVSWFEIGPLSLCLSIWAVIDASWNSLSFKTCKPRNVLKIWKREEKCKKPVNPAKEKYFYSS